MMLSVSVCVCVRPAATACRNTALVSAGKVMHYIQCSLVIIIIKLTITPRHRVTLVKHKSTRQQMSQLDNNCLAISLELTI